MSDIYNAPHLQRHNYKTDMSEQEKLFAKLNAKTDAESKRLQRYIAMADLSKQDGSPVKLITEKVLNLPTLKNLDIIETPEVITPELVFDLFNFPKDHPARSASDSYFLDANHVLRPHTSLMWKYYLDIPEIKKRLEENGSIGVLSFGKCYRRDEIDWQHSNILHQIDGFFVIRKDIKTLDQKDLENILVEVCEALYGKDVKYKFVVDHFPYTDPSVEMNIEMNGQMVEILGAGIAHPNVLKNLGIDPEKYNAWAFGFGSDRLAMIKQNIPDIRLLYSQDERVTKQLADLEHKFVPVSKYPPITRDISFIVDKSFDLNAYYELIREIAGSEMTEEVKLLDKYKNEAKFGKDKISYTFRTIYRSLDRTLTSEEVDTKHKKLEEVTIQKFGAVVR